MRGKKAQVKRSIDEKVKFFPSGERTSEKIDTANKGF
jgi:hypothetical protein